MGKIWSLLLILAIIPFALAVNLDVEKISEDEALIIGLEDPVKFTLEVTNNGATDDFSFYTFFEAGIEPKEKVRIESEETKTINISLSRRADSNLKGPVNFEYFIQGTDRTEFSDRLSVKMLELGDALEVGSTSIDPESQTLKIFIRNKVNFNFEELGVKFSSPFFNLGKDISLAPYAEEEFTVDVNKDDFSKLMAGFYTLRAKLETKGISGETEGKIEFLEKEVIASSEDKYGFIIVTDVIRKTNTGNTIHDSSTTINKNIFSRLFTTFSIEPDEKTRTGGKIMYTWTHNLAPGETVEVSVKTNWALPFLIILFLVTSIYFVKKYSQQKVMVRKKVSFVKAKGGEFALKVTVIAEAREFIEKVRIIDKLPPLVKMFERFGGELPDKISKDKKRLEWEFNHLEVGEKRVMSYIVYSKVGILGRFALPGAICRFEQEGKPKQSVSNKAYFLSEQKGRQ